MNQSRSITQRIVAWNARSWHVPQVIVSVTLGIVIAGLIMAVMVPALPRGSLRGWMVWLVTIACILLVAAVQARARRGV
jgi:amino acid transporter